MQEMRTVSFARRALLSTLLCASLSAGAFAGAVGVSASTTAPAKLAKPSCSTVTQKMIKQYLNLTVSAPRVSAAKGVPDFLCEYGDSVSSLAVVIEYNSASTVASFMSMKDSFDNNNEPPVGTGKSFGTLVNMSFSATLGSGKVSYHSVVALQKNLIVDLASDASLPALLTLMKAILVKV
jgi:hypothetical protein